MSSSVSETTVLLQRQSIVFRCRDERALQMGVCHYELPCGNGSVHQLVLPNI